MPETMKNTATTPTSSSKSSSTTVETETRESCYFPGCRRDANCNCRICIASMSAAFDLMTENVQRSTLTKLSAVRRRHLPRSPVRFNSSSFSTPDSRSGKSGSFSLELDSGSGLRVHDGKKTREKSLGFGVLMMRVMFGLGLVLWFEFGVSPMLFGILGPEFSPEVIRNLGEKSMGLDDFRERLIFLKNEVQGLVEEEVSNCSSVNSMWKVDQDGLILNSRYTLYKSLTEELAIWGWPLQTAGFLTTAYCSRSFTLLSGRLTEWKNGEMGYSIRSVNSSWTLGRWSSSAVQLDPNTWVLEYSEFPIRGNTKLVSATLEFLRFKTAKVLKRLERKLWLLSVVGRSHVLDLGAPSFRVPT